MEQAKIDRINVLAQSQEPRGAHPGGALRARRLRQEYIAAVKASLTAQLDSIYIMDRDGHQAQAPQAGLSRPRSQRAQAAKVKKLVISVEMPPRAAFLSGNPFFGEADRPRLNAFAPSAASATPHLNHPATPNAAASAIIMAGRPYLKIPVPGLMAEHVHSQDCPQGFAQGGHNKVSAPAPASLTSAACRTP